MRTIFIHTGWIKLGQLMKLAGWIQNGSDAKIYLVRGQVKLNGAAVSERGKKIVPGSEVSLAGEEPLRVELRS